MPCMTDATSEAPLQGVDKAGLRRRLIAERRSMPDRDTCIRRLEAEVGAWLASRSETVLGAYWLRVDLRRLSALWARAARIPNESEM